MKKNKLHIGLLLSSVGIMIILFASCKRYVDPPPYFEEPGDTTKPAARKVLLIGIDGAAAAEYKKMSLPILQGMLAKSKFTWDGVSDEITTDAASWKTLMSGISYSRHKIKDSTFIYSQGIGDPQHSSVPNFPSIFSYILSSSRNDMRTTLISSWSTMVERLVPEVQDPVITANDVAVKDSALKRIKTGNQDFIVLNFNSVAIAGKAGAFLADNVGYKEAALKVDAYIGELLTALKSRPGYDKSEEWLVIVTGTHGGNGNSYGGGTTKETNVFSLYYNERLKGKEFVKAGAFPGVTIKGNIATGVKARVLDDVGFYDPGTSPQTVELRIKGNGQGSYPHFFAKRTEFRTTSGWTCFASGTNWTVDVKNNAGTATQLSGGSVALFDNKWHTISIVFFADSVGIANKYLRIYRDGIRLAQANITGWNITTSAPLTIGANATTDGNYSLTGFQVADAKVFRAALTDAEIANNLCLMDITQHPQYANLVGFWPCNDGFGGGFKNQVPGRPHFSFSGAFLWEGVADLPCTTAPNTNPNATSFLVKAVDVVPTIFYWLRIPAAAAWSLEGSKWLETYESEFVKL